LFLAQVYCMPEGYLNGDKAASTVAPSTHQQRSNGHSHSGGGDLNDIDEGDAPPVQRAVGAGDYDPAQMEDLD
jgi:hypothetical protein